METNMVRYIFVDYENVQDIDTSFLDTSTKMTVLVGAEQKKLPVDLVKQSQPFGKSIEWIQVPGRGENALDFFIAFFLGKMIETNPDKEFIIYSKDKGFEPLIAYLASQGINIRKIVSFKKLTQNTKEIVNGKYDSQIQKIKDNLKKVASDKRPKNRKGLSGHIKTLLNLEDDDNINEIIDAMINERMLYEEKGRIKYALDKFPE